MASMVAPWIGKLLYKDAVKEHKLGRIHGLHRLTVGTLVMEVSARLPYFQMMAGTSYLLYATRPRMVECELRRVDGFIGLGWGFRR